MRPYEAMFILRPDLEEEAIKELVARFQEIVTSRGGEVTQVNEMGRRRLAYPIKHFREGYYVVLNFNSKPDASEELNRVARITDSVIRHMIIRDDE
ncbi:MAG: 30S ribosomal protein S6 [Bacillaceae bacterium G1]|nr:30S ribosomal protein S6 [Bacillota bacterium]OJF17870.1 MAG: 30S ribosomal protein S6 [Bacillaceae bacterium G1]